MDKQTKHKSRAMSFITRRAMVALLLVCALVLPHCAIAATGAAENLSETPIENTGEAVIQADSSENASCSTEYEVLPVIIEEDNSKRDEYEKHFLCDDGSYIAVSYPEPVHTKQGKQWVDATFPLANKGGRITSKSQNDMVSLAKSTSSIETDRLVSFVAGKHELRWSVKGKNTYRSESNIVNDITASMDARNSKTNNRFDKQAINNLVAQKKAAQASLYSSSARSSMLDAESQIEAINNAIEESNRGIIQSVSFERTVVEYPGAMGDGTTLRYVLKPGSIKEEIVLAHRGSFFSYTSQMNTDGLTAELQADNSILLKDAAGEIAAVISQPYMYDGMGADSGDFTVTIMQEGNELEITYTPDAAWLNASERAWPVVIDPELTKVSKDDKAISTSDQIDNYVYNGQGTTVMNNAGANLFVGYRPKGGVAGAERLEHRAFWRLKKLPTLDTGYKIVGASFNIRFAEGTTTMGSGGIELHRLDKPWESGKITWDNRPFSAEKIDIRKVFPASTANGRWMVFNQLDVRKTVQKWYADQALNNHGFMLMYALKENDYNSFYSADNGSGYIPYLSVKYQTGTAPSVDSFTVPATGTAGVPVTVTAKVSGTNVQHGYLYIKNQSKNIYLSSPAGLQTGAGPYSYKLENLEVGTYILDFGTRDNNGVAWSTSRTLTIGAAASSVTIAPTSASVNAGSTVDLSATVKPANSEGVTWSSGNTIIATVNSAGRVKGENPGTVKISCKTAATGLEPATPCTVTVNPNSYTALNIGSTNSQYISAGRHFWYTFTPTYDGKHSFETTGSTNTYGVLYQGTTQLDAKGTGGEGNNFRLEKSLKAGVAYRLKVQGNTTTTTGNFTVKVKAWSHAAKPTIKARSEWGAVPLDDSRKVARTRQPQRVIYHHSADNFTSTDLEATKKEIKKFQKKHMDGSLIPYKPPKSDIAYHFVIDPAGRIWVGAELDDYQRGHTSGYFDDIAVLLLGDFEKRAGNSNPNTLNDAQKSAMESIAKWLCYEYDLLRISTGTDIAPVSTHRIANPKTDDDKGSVCPGENAGSWIENELRTIINNWGS